MHKATLSSSGRSLVALGGCALLGITATVVARAGFFSRLREQATGDTKLESEGLSAKATVISAQQTGSSMESGGFQSFQVVMQLQVEPKSEPAFLASAKPFVSVMDLGKAQPGAAAVVRYDPDDKSQVAIANLLGPLSGLVQAEGQDMKQAHEMVLDSEILQDELSVRGVAAPAQVRDSQATGVVVYGAAELTRLSLAVEPEDGPSYQAETTAAIVAASAHKVRPGASLTVKYDPEQPSKVIVAKLSD